MTDAVGVGIVHALKEQTKVLQALLAAMLLKSDLIHAKPDEVADAVQQAETLITWKE